MSGIRLVFIFRENLHDEHEGQITWWHEQTHCAFDKLRFSDDNNRSKKIKEHFADKALDWVEENSEEKHLYITNRYDRDRWGGEAVSVFIEELILRNGINNFMNADFADLGELAKLADVIRYAIKYGTEETNRKIKEGYRFGLPTSQPNSMANSVREDSSAFGKKFDRGREGENESVHRDASQGEGVLSDEAQGFYAEEKGTKFSVVTDPALLKELEDGETITMYRAMVEIDGDLYPPMSVYDENGNLREPSKKGIWEQADESLNLTTKEMADIIALENSGEPGIVKIGNGKVWYKKGKKDSGFYFELKKDNGETVPARYNPYFHTSTSAMNDQFKSAWKRPNLVVAEMIVPKSELTSGYRAAGAKDQVGETPWKSGVVNTALPEERQRGVVLTRYAKLGNKVSDAESAKAIAKQLEGTDVKVPFNVVTPGVRDELARLGVEITAPEKNLGKDVYEAYDEWKGKQGETMFSTSNDVEEINARFNEELDSYINGQSKANMMFHVGNPMGVMQHFLPSLPIVMSPRVINKATNTKHDVSVEALHDLPKRISAPIFVFQRDDNALGVLTEIKDNNGKNVCVAIELNKTIQDGGTYLEVNDIRSIHGRDIENLILPIIHNNTLKYVDKEKGLDWLSSASSNYQQEITRQDLVSATKVVEIFENPPIVEQKNAEEGSRFSIVNRNQVGFVSNAMKAVEGIKQDKATPQQWLAMVQKQGGLKACEDKWLGLSEWLKGSDAKTLTKDEVLEFIGENMIQIEEVNYTETADSFNELKEEYENLVREEGFDAANEEMTNRYGDDFYIAFEDLGGELTIANEEAAAALLGSDNIINRTRLDYTTEGLDNKREIALTVPTVESWNSNDEIHFGDAGDGRAVTWIRFGETTDGEGDRVLVIDEIQSKRHQEGREKGYRGPFKVDEQREKELRDELSAVRKRKKDIVPDEIRGISERATYEKSLPEDLKAELKSLRGREQQIVIEITNLTRIPTTIPDAPFDKNWHELAIKRMLRLAAEEGFDKVAWTKGEQQAERYNLGKAFNDIEREDNPNIEGRRFVLNGANLETLQVDENGNIIDSTIEETKNKPLVEVVGKDMAAKMMSLENGDMLEGEDLRIGGEGMKGFYDKMLPSFLNKYGKKWDVKVGEITLPELEESAQKMWSVDVTPEMKESVMEGQTMFSAKRKAPETESVLEEEHQPSVVSSADGAKVLKDLDSLIKDYDENANKRPNTFLGDIAQALGATKHGSNSQYATFETMNGNIVTIRLSNHNARVSTFDNHNEQEGISIVVTAFFFRSISYLCKFIVSFKTNPCRFIPNCVTLFHIDSLVFVFVEAST